MLTANNCVGHVHLIIGTNPLASSRCAKSIEVGAFPKIVAPADSDVHYVLAKRIEKGEVEWVQKSFDDEMLQTLGREEVGGVVDAVFVTTGSKTAASLYPVSLCSAKMTDVLQVPTYPLSVGAFESLSTWSTHQIFAHSRFFRLTPMAPYRSVLPLREKVVNWPLEYDEKLHPLCRQTSVML